VRVDETTGSPFVPFGRPVIHSKNFADAIEIICEIVLNRFCAQVPESGERIDESIHVLRERSIEFMIGRKDEFDASDFLFMPISTVNRQDVAQFVRPVFDPSGNLEDVSDHKITGITSIKHGPYNECTVR
jgi:hypothetical protein